MAKEIKSLQLLAKDCMKKEKYTEAFLHLTHALNVDPNNVEMLSNRCHCLLQSQQYNLALEDVDKLLKLDTNSSLGYHRRADIHFNTFNFDTALRDYQKAFQCYDSDKEICMEGINKCKKEIIKDETLDRQYPFVGGALGIFLSSVLLVLDYLAHREESYIANPILKVAACISASVLFYWAAIFYRGSIKQMRKQLLDAPPDLFGIDDNEEHPHTD